MARPAVFIGSSKEGLEIARHIRTQLGDDAEVTIFNEGVFELGQGTLESLVNASDKFDFAILVLIGDDMTVSREQVSQSPRDNVLLECGLFIGKLGRNRTFIVYDSEIKLKIPSDLAGVSMAPFSRTRQDGNLLAAVGEACDRIRDAIKKQTAEKVIYDNRTTLNRYDFHDRENAITFDKDGKPTGPIGKGILDFDDNRVLHIKRTNAEGRFEVHLQHNGPGKPVIFKKRDN
jgi:hypothetical protein